MNSYSKQLEYLKKHTELRTLIKRLQEVDGLVKGAVKELNDVIEEKNSVVLDIKNLECEKSIIEKSLTDLEKQIIEKQGFLNKLIETETSFVSNVKQELNTEKRNLDEAKKTFNSLTNKIGELKIVVKELNEFVEKEADARKRFLEQSENLRLCENEFKTSIEEIKTGRNELDKKNKELDVFKQYVSDLYGKLASYVKVAEEVVLSVNEYLEEHKVPMRFDVPDGEIIEVNLDNFNIKPIDS